MNRAIILRMSNNSRFFFVLMSVATALGISNIWLYPYFSFKFTGLFFIPYLIALVLLGIPLLVLEFSIGQYFNKNIIDFFSSIKKWFSSIGWLMVFNAFIVMSFYAVLISWHIIYFFASFGLQWKNDAKSYFFNNVLQISNGFRSFTQFSLPVFITLILAWLLVFFFVRKGFESMKRAVLITFPMLLVLIFLFLLYTLTLDNALAGVYYFLKPQFKSLLKLDVWLNAALLALVSLGISFGVMPALARKTKKGFIVGNSLITVLFELLISTAVGFILFSILGFLSSRQGIGVDSLAFSDFTSEFIILPQALPLFYKPTLLSLLFFVLLATLFIFGTSTLAYSISHVFVHKFKTKHRNAAVIVCGFGFLAGLIFIIKPGFYIMDIVNHFVVYNILIAILFEALAIGWFFESEKIAEFINQYSILKIGMAWRFIIRFLAPFVVLLLILFQLKSDLFVYYNSYPWWAILIFGVGIVVAPIVIALLMPRRILDRK